MLGLNPMTTRELDEWRERMRSPGLVQEPDELAAELLKLSSQGRELALAELPRDMRGTVRVALAKLMQAQPAERRARRHRREALAQRKPASSPARWTVCDQCPFFGARISLSEPAPVDSMLICPSCGAELREAKPGEIWERLPPENRQALCEALADMVVRCIMSKHGRPDGTIGSDDRK